MEHFAQLPDETIAPDLPAPVRLRVMEELAGDASALLDHFRSRGMSDEAAAREVEAWVGTRPEVWRELEEIHRPIAVRWADRLLEPGRHRVERLVLLMSVIALTGAAIPLRAGLIVRAPFGTGWIVLGMAGAIVVLALRSWMLRRRTASAPPLPGVLTLIGLGAPAVGLLGAGLTLSNVSNGSVAMWNAIEIASGLATVALMAGAAAGVLWSIEKACDRITWSEQRGGT